MKVCDILLISMHYIPTNKYINAHITHPCRKEVTTMETNEFKIQGIPSVLWGGPSDQVIIGIHGNMSSKTDIPMELLARHCTARGFQLLTFDLPQHGDRKAEKRLCDAKNCVEDVTAVMEYAGARWEKTSLFANSMGAYFCMTALAGMEPGVSSPEICLFLSPIVDMKQLIEHMLEWAGIPLKRLEAEGEITSASGQVFYWDYYCYTADHPVTAWDVPTHILCGSSDVLSGPEVNAAFAERFHCGLEVLPGGEHFFHTDIQLGAYEDWLKRHLPSRSAHNAVALQTHS